MHFQTTHVPACLKGPAAVLWYTNSYAGSACPQYDATCPLQRGDARGSPNISFVHAVFHVHKDNAEHNATMPVDQRMYCRSTGSDHAQASHTLRTAGTKSWRTWGRPHLILASSRRHLRCVSKSSVHEAHLHETLECEAIVICTQC